MARSPLPTWFFVLVVVRLGHRFLLVQERKHGALWYLPAGRVEPGESLVAAAIRETREEAGVHIAVDGVLRIDHVPFPDGSGRCRVVFHAHPTDDTPPKAQEDEDSLRAAWVALPDLDRLPLRGEEVRSILTAVDGGAAIYPPALIGAEGRPWR